MKHPHYNSLNRMIGTYSDEQTAYALINLVSPREQTNVVMRLRSGEIPKVWLNGDVVYTHNGSYSSAAYKARYRSFTVSLKAGNNLLLVKVQQDGGYWDMGVQLDADFTIGVLPKAKSPPLLVSAVSRLSEITLDGKVITLTLTDVTFDPDISKIREAVSVSGIPGVTINPSSVERVSDTEVTFQLSYDLTDFDTDTLLSCSVGAGAIAGDESTALSVEIPVEGIEESVSATSPAALRELTLDGSDIILTLTGRTFDPDVSQIRVSVSGISGVTIKADSIQRLNDTQIKFQLDFDGTSFATERGLTFNVGGWATTEEIRVPPAREGRVSIYWADAGSDKIQRAKTDGSNVEDLVTGLDNPRDIALDVAGGKMYWTDYGTDKIQRANLDGSNVEDIVTGLDNPRGIALDVVGGKMYWTDVDSDKIQRANLDGSNVEDIVRGLDGPAGIALDVVGGKMYWIDYLTWRSKIQCANLGGSNVKTLVIRLNYPGDLALDVAGGKMYWTKWVNGEIQRANLDGSNVETLVTGLDNPRCIALDVAGGKMYWTDADYEKIQRANLDGSNVENCVTGLDYPIGIAVAVTPPEDLENVAEDVNRDGVVDTQDLVFISHRYGQSGNNTADVNADGVVNIDDLILVAAVIDAAAAAAAPAARSQLPKGLTAATIQQWLTEAKLTGNQHTLRYQRGILMLEQLLAALTPKETALLPNYPNPFNPETWIPYQLSESADVTLTIYAVNGQVVRALDLGHQRAGLYKTRSRAAYWDGRNAVGEPVASGLYFYTLTAGEFTATRKMLIRK